MNFLPNKFYQRDDVVQVARDLLGQVLVTNLDGMVCKGKIVETEAYCGRNDRACHASGGRRTARTEIMYQAGGRAYVYLCYGIHHLFNVVTNIEGKADAVLIRALEPLEGLDYMKDRLKSKSQLLTNGPGVLSKAMGITTLLTGTELTGPGIWVEKGEDIPDEKITRANRIGVDYAGEDALLPWRFYVKGNQWVSR